MEIQIRDKRDPFTQALAYLFRDEKCTSVMKAKLRKNMAFLVTQVAVKIGSIDTEKAIRDRALSVFTGTISLYLVHSTVQTDGNVIQTWSKMIVDQGLELLFREGYTLISDLATYESEVSFGDWYTNTRLRKFRDSGQTMITILSRHSTSCDETGMWNGYASLERLFNTKEQFEYAAWEIEQACARQYMISNKELFYDSEVVTNRVIVNIFLYDKPSLAMDYKRAAKVVACSYGKKAWFKDAVQRYRKFLSTAPKKFQNSLKKTNGNLHGSQSIFWKSIKEWPKKSRSEKHFVANLCQAVAIAPPGLIGRMFNTDDRLFKKYEINENGA